MEGGAKWWGGKRMSHDMWFHFSSPITSQGIPGNDRTMEDTNIGNMRMHCFTSSWDLWDDRARMVVWAGVKAVNIS